MDYSDDVNFPYVSFFRTEEEAYKQMLKEVEEFCDYDATDISDAKIEKNYAEVGDSGRWNIDACEDKNYILICNNFDSSWIVGSYDTKEEAHEIMYKDFLGTCADEGCDVKENTEITYNSALIYTLASWMIYEKSL